MKKIISLIMVLCLMYTCMEDINITFSEFNIEFNENAIIEINAPKAEGDNFISDTINSKIENHIANILNFGENESTISLVDAIAKFDSEYAKFKNDFEESDLVWEALFDGEVTYQSSIIISIAINSYLNTGGAHGNMNITFLNFDPITGDLLKFNDLILNKTAFEDVAKKHFKIATGSSGKTGFGDYFFGEGFQLPENIGFTDDGVILFYNVYEIASYADGVTEFTIPYNEIEAYLY